MWKQQGFFFPIQIYEIIITIIIDSRGCDSDTPIFLHIL